MDNNELVEEIESTAEKKKQLAESYRFDADRLDREVAALLEAADILRRAQESDVRADPRQLAFQAPPHPRKGVIAPTSSVGLAMMAIREANRPLHADEIVEIIQRSGFTVNRATLVSNLAKMVKYRQTFIRMGPNIFDLLERGQPTTNGNRP